MKYNAGWINDNFDSHDNTAYLFRVCYDDESFGFVSWTGYIQRGFSDDGTAELVRAVDLLSFTDVTDREQERLLCQHSARHNN